MNKIPFKFVSDYKVILIVNGKQTATSAFPSPYCYISLRALRGNKDDQDDNSDQELDQDNEDLQTKEECRKLLTYGDLRKDYQHFYNNGQIKKNANKSRSTINPPLFDEADNVFVIEKCVPPELHILQGFVNHLFWDGLVPLLG